MDVPPFLVQKVGVAVQIKSEEDRALYIHKLNQPCHEIHHESMPYSEGLNQQHLQINEINQTVTKTPCEASHNTGEKHHKIWQQQ